MRTSSAPAQSKLRTAQPTSVKFSLGSSFLDSSGFFQFWFHQQTLLYLLCTYVVDFGWMEDFPCLALILWFSLTCLIFIHSINKLWLQASLTLSLCSLWHPDTDWLSTEASLTQRPYYVHNLLLSRPVEAASWITNRILLYPLLKSTS